MNTFKRLLSTALCFCVINAGMIASTQAAMVSTEQVAAASRAQEVSEAHHRLLASLNRADVQASLQKFGVDATAAAQRIAALTDDEATRLASQINSAPAGGLIEEVIFVFFVLLITDILGFTKVYPFTRTAR